MSVRTRCLVAALTLSTAVAVVAGTGTQAGAVDQDLVVSATSGAPGTEVSVSSASCEFDESDTVVRFVQFRIVSGTAPDEQIIGIGVGDPEGVAAIVPDWVDPAEPAVVEATCYSLDFETGEQSTFDYDPVAFDVLPGAGAPTQTRTFSRTSLQAGQGFSVNGTGCDLGDDTFTESLVFEGGDLTGRTWGEIVSGFGGSEGNGDEFQNDTILSNGGIEFLISEGDDGPAVIEELNEVPTDIPAGTYTAVTACETEKAILLYEPELLTVTGNAPFDADDITFDRTTRRATIAGNECTADGVDVGLFAASTDDFFGGEDPDFALRRAMPSTYRERAGGRRFVQSADLQADALRRAGARKVTRDLDSEEFAETTLQPDADGVWSGSQKITFDRGWVEGDAVCGDPFGDGFVYDPQAAEVTLPPLEVTQTTTTTTTTPAPTAPPANARPGNANFAG